MKNNVFYIEKEKFLRSMFEIAFKNKNAEIYTIDKIEGNYYLLEDLLPTIIVFDVKTLGPELEKVLAFNDRAVLVATGDVEDEITVKGKVKNFIHKPIPALNLVKTILSFNTTIK
jgi:response regulator RpfG family c-di-GMP phosphodiesterase